MFYYLTFITLTIFRLALFIIILAFFLSRPLHLLSTSLSSLVISFRRLHPHFVLPGFERVPFHLVSEQNPCFLLQRMVTTEPITVRTQPNDANCLHCKVQHLHVSVEYLCCENRVLPYLNFMTSQSRTLPVDSSSCYSRSSR